MLVIFMGPSITNGRWYHSVFLVGSNGENKKTRNKRQERIDIKRTIRVSDGYHGVGVLCVYTRYTCHMAREERLKTIRGPAACRRLIPESAPAHVLGYAGPGETSRDQKYFLLYRHNLLHFVSLRTGSGGGVYIMMD